MFLLECVVECIREFRPVDLSASKYILVGLTLELGLLDLPRPDSIDNVLFEPYSVLVRHLLAALLPPVRLVVPVIHTISLLTKVSGDDLPVHLQTLHLLVKQLGTIDELTLYFVVIELDRNVDGDGF